MADAGGRSKRVRSRRLRTPLKGRMDAPARPERSGGAEPGWRRVGARSAFFRIGKAVDLSTADKEGNKRIKKGKDKGDGNIKNDKRNR